MAFMATFLLTVLCICGVLVVIYLAILALLFINIAWTAWRYGKGR